MVFVQVTDTSEEMIVPARLVTSACERIGTAAGTRVAQKTRCRSYPLYPYGWRRHSGREAVKSTFAPARGVPQLFVKVALTVAVVPTSGDWVDGVTVRMAYGHGELPMGVHCVDRFVPLRQVSASIPPVLRISPGIRVRRGHAVHRYIDLGDNVGSRAYTCRVRAMKTASQGIELLVCGTATVAAIGCLRQR